VVADEQAEQKGIHPVDLVLTLVAVSFAAALILLDLFAIPAYAKMYRDFAAELPFITRAVISHVVPWAAASAAAWSSARPMRERSGQTATRMGPRISPRRSAI